MDYKEKYEMALEGIQEILGSGEDSIKMSRLQLRLQGIFPELKESEDEKIRKELLVWLKSRDGQTLPIDRYNAAIAWLEKQGEQKPADSKNIDLDELVIELEETIGTSPHSRETIKDFFQKAVQKYMKCLQIANGEIGRLMDENYYLKEQKPAEWSDEDYVMQRAALEILMASPKLVASTILKESVIEWLKSLKDRCTWKPDSSMLICLEYAIKHINKDGDKRILSKLLEQLKQL